MPPENEQPNTLPTQEVVNEEKKLPVTPAVLVALLIVVLALGYYFYEKGSFSFEGDDPLSADQKRQILEDISLESRDDVGQAEKEQILNTLPLEGLEDERTPEEKQKILETLE